MNANDEKLRLIAELSEIARKHGIESDDVEMFIIINSYIPGFQEDARDALQLMKGITNDEPEEEDEDPYNLGLNNWRA